jgi:hypothetical protein
MVLFPTSRLATAHLWTRNYRSIGSGLGLVVLEMKKPDPTKNR